MVTSLILKNAVTVINYLLLIHAQAAASQGPVPTDVKMLDKGKKTIGFTYIFWMPHFQLLHMTQRDFITNVDICKCSLMNYNYVLRKSCVY